MPVSYFLSYHGTDAGIICFEQIADRTYSEVNQQRKELYSLIRRANRDGFHYIQSSLQEGHFCPDMMGNWKWKASS